MQLHQLHGKRDFKDSCRMSLCYLFNRSTFRQRIKDLQKVFQEKNNYPKYIVKQILDKAFEEHYHKNATNTTLDEQNETKHKTSLSR